MKILLAEDDRKLGSYLQKLFTNYGHEIDLLANGAEIEYYAQNNDYDVLILDWMLPGKDGVDACAQLRQKSYQGGIIILTARAELADKIKGFNCGADDYLPKPFEFEELYARAKALQRRATNNFQNETFQVASCSFDCTEKTITCGERKVALTNREFQIVELLARNPGQAISREIILDRVWGLEKEVTSNTLDAYIKLIRKKLEQISKKTFIHSIRSVGYRWEETDV